MTKGGRREGRGRGDVGVGLSECSTKNKMGREFSPWRQQNLLKGGGEGLKCPQAWRQHAAGSGEFPAAVCRRGEAVGGGGGGWRRWRLGGRGRCEGGRAVAGAAAPPRPLRPTTKR